MKQQLILALATFIAIVVVACNQNSVPPDDATASTLATARIAGVTSSSAASCSATRGSSETVITASQLPAAVLTYLIQPTPATPLCRPNKVPADGMGPRTTKRNLR